MSYNCIRRLNEGKNEAMYHIGYADSGFPVGLSDEELQESLRNLRRIAISIDCTIFVRHILVGENGRVAQVVVNRREHCKVLPENVTSHFISNEEHGITVLCV